MPYRPARKAALLIPSGPQENPDQLHLHVILTDVCQDGLHLIGPICSIREGIRYDETCIIEAKRHGFVRHPSYFEYRRLKTMKGVHLTKCVDGWVYRKKEDVSEELYEQICLGTCMSEFTPNGMIAYWKTNKPD